MRECWRDHGPRTATTNDKRPLRIEIRYVGDHQSNLGFSEFREHRQCQNFLRGLLGDWQVPGFQPEIGKGRLQVQGQWVVNLGTDFSVSQELPHFIATLRTNDILMK